MSKLIKERWCYLYRIRSVPHYLVLLLKEKNKSWILQLSLWHLLFQDPWLLQSPPDPDHHHNILSTIKLQRPEPSRWYFKVDMPRCLSLSPQLPLNWKIQPHFVQNWWRTKSPQVQGSSGEQEFLRRSPILLLITCHNCRRASKHSEVSLVLCVGWAPSFFFEQMTPAIKTITKLHTHSQAYKTDREGARSSN